MKTTIHVTTEDIVQGEPENCYKCPIALAAHRVFPSAGYVVVTTDEIVLYTVTHKPFHYDNLPAIGREFVRRFDEGDQVDPFDFELDILVP